ncbi:hypothetical protein [Marininema halotolerans]|uniref:Uncharacterized protein n=1 Tax=Marininema halotolerans TaxID=1155944 RepID=A0A1I6SGW7_9BACL|nr:hypothetical protein [Marininema halotolerans]SFS76154.1 hypothetical protein SAMN05444972_10779 [Marininema halotolerans]
MEFSLMSKKGAYPCEVRADEDQTQFWIRNADTTGEFFNTKYELLQWIRTHWHRNEFIQPEEYDQLVSALSHEM